MAKIDFKNRTLIILILLGVGMDVSAQFHYGIKAGINVCDMSIKTSLENVYPTPTKFKAGYHAGVFFLYDLSSVVSIESGLLFTTKGYSVDLDKYISKDNTPNVRDLKVDGYSRSTFNYIEIPLRSRIKVFKNIYALAGAYFAVGVGGKDKADYTVIKDGGKEHIKYGTKKEPVFSDIELLPIPGTNFYTFPEGNPYYGIDFGLQAGLGYQFKAFMLSADYSLGLVNTVARVSGRSDKNFINKHRVISVSVSYPLDFKKGKD